MVESLAADDVVTNSSTNYPDGEDREKIIMDTNEDCEINGSNILNGIYGSQNQINCTMQY